jgi:cysteinyl-tRNA synthetase
MSKSLGNFITIRDALKHNHGETIRYLLLSTHYRQALDWTEGALFQAKQALDRFYAALRSGAEYNLPEADIDPRVLEALSDDLNTPLAFSHLHDLVSALNKATDESERRQLTAILRTSGQFLGFFQDTAEAWFKGYRLQDKAGLTDEQIENLINQRIEARKAKDFALSDQLRNTLASQGILLEDTPHGTLWRRR